MDALTITLLLLCSGMSDVDAVDQDPEEGVTLQSSRLERLASAADHSAALQKAIKRLEFQPDSLRFACLVDSMVAKAIPVGDRMLSPKEMALISAKLANDKCEAFFGGRPFVWSQNHIERITRGWVWGNMDVLGVQGHSASVRMEGDGSQADVKVYFSSDSRFITSFPPERRFELKR